MSILSTQLRMACRVCLAVSALASYVHAQGNGVVRMEAPLVGLTTNATNTRVSAIQGVPGASTIGDSIALPAGVNRVFLAPLQRWALVEQGPTRMLGRLSFQGSTPGSVVPVAGAVSSPLLVSFSSNGRNAALLSPTRETLQVLSGLADSPEIAMQCDVSGLDVTAAAISDDGAFPVVLTKAGDLYLLSPGGSRSLLMRTGSNSAIGFLASRASLVVADGAAGTVTVIDGLNASFSVRPPITGLSLSSGAVFMRGLSDGTAVVLAGSGSRTAYRVDLQDQSVRSLEVPATVSRMDPLSGDAFLFSANPNQAAWILQADNGNFAAAFAQFAGRSRRVLAFPDTSIK